MDEFDFSLFQRLCRDWKSRVFGRAEFRDKRRADGSGKGLSLRTRFAARSPGDCGTDPSNDLDGWDAAVKVVALAIVLMGIPVKLEQVQRTGIPLSRKKSAACAPLV
jgi:hypothetical protein